MRGAPPPALAVLSSRSPVKHTFAERWNEMQHNLAPAQPSQLHPSLNSPQSGNSASPSHTYSASLGSTHVSQHTSSASVIRHSITLALPPHTDMEIQKVLISNPSSPLCTKIHLAHPTLPLTIKNIHSLHNRTPLSLPQLFYHLRITATSPLLPRDWSLSITLDNVVHILSPPTLNGETPPHRLHLFLNPHNRMPFLRHTHDVDEHTR